jgi:Leucine-rich repeat (LRR) protein
LTGTTPTKLGLLTYLEGLDLSANQLSGMIPTGLRNLTSLAWFLSESNNVDGRILDLSPPSNLKTLTCFDNLLAGTLPTELGLLTELTYSDLSNNHQFTGMIPMEFGNLRNVSELYLESITSEEPSWAF